MRSKRLGIFARGAAASVAIALALTASNDVAVAQTPPAAASPPKPLSESLTGLAKAEYEAGKVLYGDKDYPNAIVKFERAYELARDPRLLWNVAVCEKNLRRYARMLATIKRYRAEAASMMTDAERAQSDEIVKTVQQFVSALKVSASEAGADVFVDDEKVGTTPLAEPVIVDVGVRKIRVAKQGFKDGLVSQPVAGGGELAVDVRLEKELHRGRLVVQAGESDLIALDGSVVGKGRWEGTVASGGHTLRVTAPGMATHQSEPAVKDGETRRIDVTLNPLPKADAGRALVWIIGGVALATATVVTSAVLFKPTKAPGIEGNINPGSVQLSFGGKR